MRSVHSYKHYIYARCCSPLWLMFVLYGETPPEMGYFFRLQVYEGVGVSLVEVYERVQKSVISIGKKAQKD